MTTTDSHHIKVDKHRLEVAWYGPPPMAAPTLVFLHEGLGCVKMWRDFPARLSAETGCGALVYSRLGYGASDPCPLPRPIRFMHDEALQVLPELLTAAAIHEAILIGHSDGGSIAIIHAGGAPAPCVRGIITEAAHVFCEDICIQSIHAAKHNYQGGDLRTRLEPYHGANTDCAFRGWNDTWLHPDFVNWNIESYLPGIAVPMLAIQGEDDNYGTPAQVQAIASKTRTELETLMLPDCGHSPHRDQPELTLTAMKRFVGKVF